MQLAPYNVNVNTICPGMVWTPMWSHQATIWQKIFPEYQEMTVKEVFDQVMMGKTLLNRSQSPEDIGNAVVFLVSEEAKEITGQALNVDGGKLFN